MIEVHNITAKYGEFIAVDGVSFSITQGEVVGLLGHNGAGKTTIMKILTGYLEPSSGKALIDSKEVGQQRIECQSIIGYLPENCPLYPEMTTIEYLEHVAKVRGLDEAKIPSLIRKAIERTKLSEKAFSTIGTLSRGFRQRVGVAQAILHEPRILILDEPTNGLDPAQIEEMRGLIRELSETATVVVSTHILQEVSAVCSRVLILNRGKLVVDSEISALERSESLLVSTDLDETQFAQALKNLDLGSTQMVRSSPNFTYQVTLKDPLEVLAPLVARSLVNGGGKVFALQPEVKSLETIFREATNQNTH